MNPAAAYVWIKALHVASILAFIAGVVAQSLFLAAAWSDTTKELARQFHRAERHLTTPSLLIALASGATLAALGRWFPAPWLVLKLVLVFLVLAVHGIQSVDLRRLAAGQPARLPALRHVLLAAIAAIAFLAVLKPQIL